MVHGSSEMLKFLKIMVQGYCGEVAPSGSISSQDMPIWFFGIMLFKFSQHVDSNYQYLWIGLKEKYLDPIYESNQF